MPTLLELVAELARFFPRFLPDDRQEAQAKVRDYLRELAHVPPGPLEQAVRRIVRTMDERSGYPWGPSVARILREVAEQQLGLPDEAGALAQVGARVAWGRSQEGEPPPVHPLVAEALALVGGYPAFRATDEPAVLRGQFGRLYRELRGRAIGEAQAGPALEPGPTVRELEP